MDTYKPSKDLQVAERVFKTSIPGLFYIEHKQFDDDRGFYAELGIVPDIESVIGKEFRVMQMNQAFSEKNVIRGLHAENWNKLVTIASGRAFCALVDVRPTSETFAKVETFELGRINGALNGSLYISAGIANSMCVLDAPVNYLYAVDQLYRDRDPSGDVAISLFDEELAISWPIPLSEMVISDRDRNAVTLREKFPLI